MARSFILLLLSTPLYEEILAASIPANSSFTGRAIRRKKTLIFNDAGTNPSGYQIPATHEEKRERIIVIPFISNGKPLGAMCLNRLENDFDEKDTLLAELSAIHATNSLKNAQIHKALQDEIDDRKRIEKQLLSNEERLNIIFEYAPDAIYINDLMAKFLDGNKAAERLTGYRKEELAGKNLLSAKLLTVSQTLKAARLLARNSMGKPTGPDEFILTQKDGSAVDVEVRTHPVIIAGKTLVLGIARDITERNSLQQQKQKINELLLQSQKMESIGRLAGGVAHEFNNLLTAIMGFSELILHQLGEDSPLNADIMSIIGATKQAAALAHQLLAFSRKKAFECNPLDLNRLIEGMAPVLNLLVEEDISIYQHLDFDNRLRLKPGRTANN
jgi:PAS domain S-box-containing protein